ncbi:MAG: recombinase family protein [Candidatus Omnitrophota bacterium]
MKFFLYARKSTDTEDKQVLSIQSQLNEVREFAKKENLAIVQEFQEAKTAKSPGRPIFNEMVKRIEKGEASGIIAWHPDRLSRNSIDGGKIIYLVDTGKIVDLRFPTYRFDNSAQGKFMLNIIFGQSKYYVDNLSENTKRGLREKVRLGEFPGFSPIGYLNDRNKIVVDEAAAPLVKKLYALCAEGSYTQDQLRKLATALGLVSKRRKRPLSYSNVHRILTNLFYLGLFVYKGEIFQGSHPAIIEKKLFDKVQEILKFRSRQSLTKKHYFVFRGLIRCAECGCQITAEVQKGHRYYHCGKKRDPCPQSSVFIREENLAQQIKEAILKVALDDGAFSYMMQELNREITLANAERVHNRVSAEIKNQEIEDQLKRLLDLLVRGVIGEEEYKREKAQLINKKFDNLDGGNPDGDWHERFKNFLTLAHQASYIAAEANLEAQRDFLRRAVSNLKLLDGNLIVSYTSAFKIAAETANEDMGSRFTKKRIFFGSEIL